ncbi:hypothetical protein BCR44DRAFT_29749 [Catenaria anguillulae PL171]|uniref:RING-type E3 ubiquitin transferase n=1 Tax=Catenaria anguillulae PL171 TaxID=765915 RepID=A0A1Y2HQC5_9FUNG|nr:hypothetical protein BCR44DRAFT_29749 [Catenaria anguillulae PL171]
MLASLMSPVTNRWRQPIIDCQPSQNDEVRADLSSTNMGSAVDLTMDDIHAVLDQFSTAASPATAGSPYAVVAVRHFVDNLRIRIIPTLLKPNGFKSQAQESEQVLARAMQLALKQALNFASGPLPALSPAARQGRKRVKVAARALIELIAALCSSASTESIDLIRRLTSRLATILPDIADVTCPICLEVFVDPIAMRCGHRLCSTCFIALRNATPPPRPGTVVLTFTNDVMRPVIMSALPALDDEASQLMNSPPPTPTSPLSLERFPTGSSSVSTASSLGPGPHTAPGRPNALIAPAADVVGRPGTYSMTYVSPFISPAPLDTAPNDRGKSKSTATPARPLMQRLPCPICRCITRVAAADPKPLAKDKAMDRWVRAYFPIEYERRREELRREWVVDQLNRLFSVPTGALGPRSPAMSAMPGGARVLVL